MQSQMSTCQRWKVLLLQSFESHQGELPLHGQEEDVVQQQHKHSLLIGCMLSEEWPRQELQHLPSYQHSHQ